MKIAVIGAGVSGLTVASELSDLGEVTVISDAAPLQSTSAIATAVWHLYKVDAGDPTTLDWGERTLVRLWDLVAAPASGVELIAGVELFRRAGPYSPAWSRKAPSFAMLSDVELARSFPGVRWGYRVVVPAANMRKYLPWLVRGCRDRSVYFRTAHVESWQDVSEYDVVVNCTGLRARGLTRDPELYGLRGQYLVLEPPKRSHQMEYVGDDDHPDGMAYAIQRDGELLVGGTEEETEELVFDESEDQLLARAGLFCRADIEGAVVTDRVVGVRPCRRSGTIAFGWDADVDNVFHNYGHGGSGFSLSWGCAETIKSMLASA